MGLEIVFAGCGGTFWTASPMLAALVKKIRPGRVAFFDPDVVSEQNLTRQWVNEGVGAMKARIGREAIFGTYAGETAIYYAEAFPLADGYESTGDVIVVTNVDTNKARMDIREWCRHRQGIAGMIVSGCDQDYGQVYPGLWKDGEPLVDWLDSHPDVQEQGMPGDACGQNIMSNAQTGVFLGWALRDMIEFYQLVGSHLTEYYWKRGRDTGLKVWTERLSVKELVR